jgi:DNA-binding response OmpR family regulator
MTDRPLVLCADDEDDILALVRLRLDHAGFDVVTASDGEAALAMIRERRPSVCVLDVMMPRLDGYEVVAAIRSDPSLADLKVILLSARVQQGDVDLGLAAGADAYLAKPFRASELVERIEELLGR